MKYRRYRLTIVVFFTRMKHHIFVEYYHVRVCQTLAFLHINCVVINFTSNYIFPVQNELYMLRSYF